MALSTLILSTELRPAYHALIACAKEVADTHGEEVAAEWAQKVLSQDFDLFVRMSVEKPRATLQLIAGGRDG